MSNTVFKNVTYITVSQEETTQRIDNYLFRLLKGVPKSRIYRMIRGGEVRVNKKRVDASYKLALGEIIRIPPVVVLESQALDGGGLEFWAKELRNHIVFENPLLIAFNKPYGLAVHGGSGMSVGLIEALKAHWPEAKNWELVHRIDKDTSGCLLLAKKRSVLREIQASWRAHEIEKHYVALLQGSFGRGRRVSAPLIRTLKGQERWVMVDPDGKESISDFTVLKKYKLVTLVEVCIKTGRTHQIRVHAQHMGHSILGDSKYGTEEGGLLAKKLGLNRLFLHAHRLSFILKGESYSIEAPYEASLLGVLEHLNKLE
jgi:23S rRNA pseudouridine955/2504/2580 synthase